MVTSIDINNTTALNHTIVGLKPGTTYKVDIDRIDEETGVKILYKRIIKTLALGKTISISTINIFFRIIFTINNEFQQKFLLLIIFQQIFQIMLTKLML